MDEAQAAVALRGVVSGLIVYTHAGFVYASGVDRFHYFTTTMLGIMLGVPVYLLWTNL